MNKRPEVGDTVVVRGVVLSVAPTFCYIRTDDESSQLGISFERISEIIPKPWEPKVGCKCFTSLYEVEILAIVQGWALISFPDQSVGAASIVNLREKLSSVD